MCVTVSNCRHFGAPDVRKCVIVVIFESGLCQRRPHVCNYRQFGAPGVRKCVTVIIFPSARGGQGGRANKYPFFKIWAATLITPVRGHFGSS